MTHQQLVFILTLAVIFVMSVITFIMFIIDKKRAEKGNDRIKEKTLLSFSACFGALGALLGRLAARHKTEKIYFSIVIIASLVLHVALVVYLLVLAYFI